MGDAGNQPPPETVTHMITHKLVKHAVVVLAVVVGLAALGSSARAEAWLYGGNRQGDYFENVGGGSWHEVVSANTTYYFRETQRGNGYIILEDASRAVRIWMNANAVWIEYPGSGGWRYFASGRYQR